MSSTTYTLLALLLCIGCASWALPTARIQGGTDAASGQFPYVVSVRLDSTHICGGSIISEKHILTAAHCVADENDKAVSTARVSVRAGSLNQFSGGVLIDVAAIALHPNFDDIEFDIAVLELQTALTLSNKIGVIEFATTAAEEPPLGATVTVAGWGEQSSGTTPYKLQSAAFTVASQESCVNAYADADESVICVAHELKQGNCHGDAGNGAVYNGKLVAVSNFIVGACGSRYPDVYANVAHYAEWIAGVIA